MATGLFGDLFDLNGDGELDIFEQAAEFAFFQSIIEDDDDDDDNGGSIRPWWIGRR